MSAFEITGGGGGKVDVRAIRRMARGDEIFIGFPSGMELPGGQDAAQLAEWLHDGTATIVARPFLLQGLGAGMGEIRKAMKLYLAEKAKRENVESLRLRVATTAVGAVQEFVRGDYYKTMLPNAPATIRAKGGKDTPLIDTGALIDATTYQIGQAPETRVPELQQDSMEAAE
jgi:hypothetical protein